MKRHQYSAEEKDFVRDNISSHSYTQLAKEFSSRFNVNVSPVAIEHKCARWGFNHGHKGVKFVRGANNPFSPTVPIGSEQVSAGKVYIKIANNPVANGKRNKDNWIQKNRYVYEQNFGKIPKGYHLIPLDGNKNNFSPDNLYAIPKKVQMMMGANKWFGKDRDITLSAIKYCELFYAIREEKSNENDG